MSKHYNLNAIQTLLEENPPKQIVKLLDNLLYLLVNYNDYEQLNKLSDYYHQLKLLRDSFEEAKPHFLIGPNDRNRGY